LDSPVSQLSNDMWDRKVFCFAPCSTSNSYKKVIEYITRLCLLPTKMECTTTAIFTKENMFSRLLWLEAEDEQPFSS
jgi:hypothetical protein